MAAPEQTGSSGKRRLAHALAAAAAATGLVLLSRTLAPAAAPPELHTPNSSLAEPARGEASLATPAPALPPTPQPDEEYVVRARPPRPWREPLPQFEPGRNHPSCKAQPGRGQFAEHGVKQCPVPGLNNLLYTQHNRYFCAVRDRVQLRLRDRVCMKYSTDWFRYSDIIAVDWKRPGAAAVCWGDDTPDPERTILKGCEWKHTSKWYGSATFWDARSHVDFRREYYDYARRWLDATVGPGLRYLSVHLRRGDFVAHCIKLAHKREPPFVTFSFNKKHRTMSADAYGEGCYPSDSSVVNSVRRALAATVGLQAVFVSTNDPGVVDMLRESLDPHVRVLRFEHAPEAKLRRVDAAIIDILLLGMGDAWLLNRYSSFSATAYETARIHGRMKDQFLWWW
eukprot:TRINITY_DN18986_c0_g1_i2.p1 TRINITY_DN18986_c0_g1~~TRINITY_DN18986_c0_g1_i2.p1  ORF type:complete len:413 (+),score=125.54 TRINITY_DN18986_c0_g1_i2:54-1241(+)